MKFFKLVPITDDEYIEQTGDCYYPYCAQSNEIVGNEIYIAVQDEEEYIKIDSSSYETLEVE